MDGAGKTSVSKTDERARLGCLVSCQRVNQEGMMREVRGNDFCCCAGKQNKSKVPSYRKASDTQGIIKGVARGNSN
jgi:hypothetical protein